MLKVELDSISYLRCLLCYLNSLPFLERKGLYLVNATTKNLDEYSKSAVKMSFSQTADIPYGPVVTLMGSDLILQRDQQSDFAVFNTMFPIAHKVPHVG